MFSVPEGLENSDFLAVVEAGLMQSAKTFFRLLQEPMVVIAGCLGSWSACCFLAGCHFLSSCLQLRLADFGSIVYHLACLGDLLRLLGLMGVTMSAHSVIQAVHWLSDTLLQLR